MTTEKFNGVIVVKEYLKKLKFESVGTNSITPCPYGAGTINYPNKIGSISCQGCKDFVGIDNEEGVVVCKANN